MPEKEPQSNTVERFNCLMCIQCSISAYMHSTVKHILKTNSCLYVENTITAGKRPGPILMSLYGPATKSILFL